MNKLILLTLLMVGLPLLFNLHVIGAGILKKLRSNKTVEE